eukprot:1910988-Pyramimonas_sp.AAC.1
MLSNIGREWESHRIGCARMHNGAMQASGHLRSSEYGNIRIGSNRRGRHGQQWASSVQSLT